MSKRPITSDNLPMAKNKVQTTRNECVGCENNASQNIS